MLSLFLNIFLCTSFFVFLMQWLLLCFSISRYHTKYQMRNLFPISHDYFWRMRKLDFFTDFRQKKIWLLSSYILLYIYMTYLSQTVSILVWKKACTILYIWYNILFCYCQSTSIHLYSNLSKKIVFKNYNSHKVVNCPLPSHAIL